MDSEVALKKESSSALARRRAAEARRRKILEASKERISAVEGIPLPKVEDIEETAPAAPEESGPAETVTNAEKYVDELEANNDHDEEEAADAHDGDDVKPSQEDGGTWKPPSTSRLQQMRRRRFKKNEGKKDDADEEEKKDEPSTDQVLEGEVTTDKPPKSQEDQCDDQPKQYVGVARLRRQKILEQRAKEAEHVNDSDLVGTTPLTIEELRNQKLNLFQRHTPIILELVVMALLVLCGVDVGYQTFVHNTGFGVNDILEFQQSEYFNAGERRLLYENGGVFKMGIHAGRNIPFVSSSSAEVGSDKIRQLMQANLDQIELDNKHELLDEFEDKNKSQESVSSSSSTGTSRTSMVDEDDDEEISFDNPYDKKKNLQASKDNPLAGLEYIFDFFLGLISRFIGIITGIFSFSCPPVFFVAAVAIRQAGRMIGCRTPAEVEQERQEELETSLSAIKSSDEGKSLPSIDIFGMIKKFIASNFKGLASLYAVLKDSRSDVYIIIFGWILGLVLPKFYLWHFVMQQDTASEKDGTCSFWGGRATSSFTTEL